MSVDKDKRMEEAMAKASTYIKNLKEENEKLKKRVAELEAQLEEKNAEALPAVSMSAQSNEAEIVSTKRAHAELENAKSSSESVCASNEEAISNSSAQEEAKTKRRYNQEVEAKTINKEIKEPEHLSKPMKSSNKKVSDCNATSGALATVVENIVRLASYEQHYCIAVIYFFRHAILPKLCRTIRQVKNKSYRLLPVSQKKQCYHCSEFTFN